MRVLALPKYGPLAASTRQRFLQYEPALKAAGIDVDYAPLLPDSHLRRVAAGRRPSPLSIASAYGSRLARLARTRNYDLLWVYCEFFPYLPGVIETASASLAAKPILFDCDDAIFHMYDANAGRLVRWALEGKLEPLLRRAKACCCGNRYLEDYASRFCGRCTVLPTVVDTNVYRPLPKSPGARLVIGWIGSPSTWCNVQPLLPVLREVTKDREVRFRAIGAGPEARAEAFPGLELSEWRLETEVEDVQRMDIGIMPLLDQPFQRGKSGFKLIQYMACGLPVIASPVGVNSEIVSEDVGLLARSPDEWRSALEQLIASPELRRRMGAAGRDRAKSHYSLSTHAPRLVELMRSVAPKGV
jgi:glycosyltransferase involved in cell wall biosynthesis